jgi:hypothetical protein
MAFTATAETLHANVSGTDFLNPEFWEHTPDIGGELLRTSPTEQIHSFKSNIFFLGTETQEVRVKTELSDTGERVKSIDVVVLEVGNYLAQSDSNVATGKADWKAQRAIQQRKNKWPSMYNSKKREIESYMTQNFGTFKHDHIGNIAAIQKNFREYEKGDFTIQLLFNPLALIEVTIIKTENKTHTIVGPTFVHNSNRKANFKNNVKTNLDGDHYLEVPMMNQGPRGYCGWGTLAMLATYYGMSVNIDELVSKNEAWDLLSKSICQSCRLVETHKDGSVSFYLVMENIERGQPIIVSRWCGPGHTGGHSSLITGYNKKTSEVLLTESWGESARNHRMPIKSLQDNMWAYCIFAFY